MRTIVVAAWTCLLAVVFSAVVINLRVRAQESGYHDQLVVADYDGDGRDDPALVRTGVDNYLHWYVLPSSTGVKWDRLWGSAAVGDVPYADDFDGDGKADLAVYRQSTAYWYVLLSSTGYSTYWTVAPLVL